MHPTKREVGFLDEEAIIERISDALQKVLVGQSQSRAFEYQVSASRKVIFFFFRTVDADDAGRPCSLVVSLNPLEIKARERSVKLMYRESAYHAPAARTTPSTMSQV